MRTTKYWKSIRVKSLISPMSTPYASFLKPSCSMTVTLSTLSHNSSWLITKEMLRAFWARNASTVLFGSVLLRNFFALLTSNSLRVSSDLS